MIHGSATRVSTDTADHAGVEGTALPDLIQEDELPAWAPSAFASGPEGQCQGYDDGFKFCNRPTQGGKTITGSCNMKGTACVDVMGSANRRLADQSGADGIVLADLVQETGA